MTNLHILQQEKMDLFSDAKQDLLKAHLRLDSSKATGTLDFPEQSVTKYH